MLPRPIEPDEPLGAENEAQWDRLRSQVELVDDAFWLGFVFSPSPRSAIVLRERVERLLRAQTRPLLLIKPETPNELREVLRRLVDDEEPIQAGCTWVEAVRSDSTGAKDHPWTDAWDDLFLRANVRRDVLRKRLRGGLVFAAAPEMKARVREAAPDLWHVRSMVIDLAAVRPAVEAAWLEAAGLPRLEAVTPAPDPAFALAEAERREARGAVFSQALSLMEAAEGWMAKGDARQARDAARKAWVRLRGSHGAFEALALAALAAAETMDADSAAAADHIEQAIAILRRNDPERLPLDWYSLAGQLAFERSDLSSAQRFYNEAVTAARTRLAGRRDVRTLRELATVLRELGHMQGEAGLPERAAKTLEEAVATYRELSSLESTAQDIQRDLAGALVWLSSARRTLGDSSAAVASSEEAVSLFRRLRAQRGDELETLDDLAAALDSLGMAKLDSGNLPDAVVAFDESLMLLEKEHELSNDDPIILGNLSRVLNNASIVMWESGDAVGAARLLEESLAHCRQLRALSGDTPQTLRSLFLTLGLLGEIRQKNRELTVAAALHQESVAIARKLAAVEGALPWLREALQMSLSSLAATRRAQGDEAAARAAEEEAASLEQH